MRFKSPACLLLSRKHMDPQNLEIVLKLNLEFVACNKDVDKTTKTGLIRIFFSIL